MTDVNLIMVLAVIIAGECGTIGGTCEVEVARTMANRYVVAGDWAEVVGAYYGRGEPTVASWVAASAALSAPAAMADGRYVYVYSDQDREVMGWRRGDTVMCGPPGCLHFAADWPGPP